ncbi:MAG: ATP-dependent helicase [Patescibacteria group bacterium]
MNDEQYRVVTEADGPCLVLAGAGSGKTRTLVFRVAYLIEMGIKPENILLMTFTNKAAREMLERVEKYLGFKPKDLWGGTFHHIGNLTLRKYADKLGYNRNFNILDQDDSISLVKSAMAELGLNAKGQNFPKVSAVQAMISYTRNTNGDLRETVEDYYSYPDFIAQKMEEIAFIYEKKKKAANVMDFDDILLNWLRLLEQFPDVRERLAKQFQYILVDEYQDTNYIQAEIIRHLSSFHNNVLVVGDDSQSIYSFRAADVKNILNFPKLFSNTKIFKIETNYRSTPQILTLANNIIENNLDQFRKELKADRGAGVLPVLIPARDDHQQASLVTAKIMQRYRDGLNYSDMAVLYRSTYQSAEIQLELSKQNIPYVVRGGMRYFEQAHIKDVIAYLRIMANFQDSLAWKRVLSMYDGIGEKRAEDLWKNIQKFNSLDEILLDKFEFKGKTGESWNMIKSVLSNLVAFREKRKAFMSEAVEYVLAAGYESYLKNNYENYRDRLDDLQQLINFVANYNDLEQLLADVTLSESFAGEHEHDKKVVVLSTIHQAKGLEWPMVFIVGLCDGHFPHHKCLEKPKELEEERRLFYVAVTRAQNELFLLYPIRSFSYKFGEVYSKPSMFIRELDKKGYLIEGRGPFEADNEDDEQIIYVN